MAYLQSGKGQADSLYNFKLALTHTPARPRQPHLDSLYIPTLDREGSAGSWPVVTHSNAKTPNDNCQVPENPHSIDKHLLHNYNHNPVIISDFQDVKYWSYNFWGLGQNTVQISLKRFDSAPFMSSSSLHYWTLDCSLERVFTLVILFLSMASFLLNVTSVTLIVASPPDYSFLFSARQGNRLAATIFSNSFTWHWMHVGRFLSLRIFSHGY